MFEKKYIVYMHIVPNGKKYIGITCNNINKRWRKGKGYWSNEYFTNAINKYGWDNIQHLILFDNLSKKEAECKEKELINFHNTYKREYGYNIEKGGSLNKEISNETREKLRKSATGVFPSIETRTKMSNSHKGKNCYWYGKHLSNEHKEKLRIKSNKKVIQYDDNFNVINIYDSLTIAAKKYNVTRQAISCCCNGRCKKTVGYIWRYENG